MHLTMFRTPLFQLMPSPKWKLVVDIGEIEETVAVSAVTDLSPSVKEESLETTSVTADTSTSNAPEAPQGKDGRIEEVVALLGKYMPSDSSSPLAPYVSGFMSLRLMLLRFSRSTEEEELVRTMMDSYSSYALGGREQSDIAVMLARDFLFLSQQQQASSFLGAGQSFVQPTVQASADANSISSGLSLFGLPSTRFSLENSPALTPIPAPGSIDALSIVSN
jgi:hypothetical protein